MFNVFVKIIQKLVCQPKTLTFHLSTVPQNSANSTATSHKIYGGWRCCGHSDPKPGLRSRKLLNRFTAVTLKYCYFFNRPQPSCQNRISPLKSQNLTTLLVAGWENQFSNFPPNPRVDYQIWFGWASSGGENRLLNAQSVAKWGRNNTAEINFAVSTIYSKNNLQQNFFFE